MRDEEIINEYFDWLYDIVCADRYSSDLTYRKLLMFLHDQEFTWIIKKDRNRAADGVDLRYRFAQERGYQRVPACLDKPCSVLEMMIALSLRCEETIMDDPQFGNRTGQWFWKMIVNLGLGYMNDKRFDKNEAGAIVLRLLNRDFNSDGSGGLFTIRNCEYDLRDVEIWTTMLWWLDSII